MLLEIGTAFAKLREVRRARAAAQTAFEAERLGRFRKLVAYADARSPYYRDLIRARGIDVSRALPGDFPVLTKSTLMANFDRIVTDPLITKRGVSEFLEQSHDPTEKYLNRYRLMHTSGTSGEVGYFVYSAADWVRALSTGNLSERRKRIQRRMRVGSGRMRVAFYGATGGHFTGVTMATSAREWPFGFFFEVKTFEINSPLAGAIAGLNAFQPDVISGYTTALKMLGEKQIEGALRIAPVAFACSGETVTAADMAFLKRAFNDPIVTSAYVCTEHLALGASDPDGETMTLNDHDLMFEFADDHCIFTNLFNYTMPLIRYRMSDILTPLDAGARPLRIKNLVGRTEMMPTFLNADGVSDFISPHIINEVFVPGVTRFQMRLTGPSAFRFLVVLEAKLDAEARVAAVSGVEARLKEILAGKSLSNVMFTIEQVDDLPLNKRTRKFNLIMDER